MKHFNKRNETIWNVIKSETDKTDTIKNISTMNVEGKSISKQCMIANAFNKYFLSVAENIITNKLTNIRDHAFFLQFKIEFCRYST